VILANSSSTLQLTVTGRWNSRTNGFSYDAPVISQVLVYNSPKMGVSLTLGGLNFGAADYTGMASIGLTAAEVTMWTSDTGLLLKAPGGYGGALQVCTRCRRERVAGRCIYSIEKTVSRSARTVKRESSRKKRNLSAMMVNRFLALRFATTISLPPPPLSLAPPLLHSLSRSRPPPPL